MYFLLEENSFDIYFFVQMYWSLIWKMQVCWLPYHT